MDNFTRHVTLPLHQSKTKPFIITQDLVWSPPQPHPSDLIICHSPPPSCHSGYTGPLAALTGCPLSMEHPPQSHMGLSSLPWRLCPSVTPSGKLSPCWRAILTPSHAPGSPWWLITRLFLEPWFSSVDLDQQHKQHLDRDGNTTFRALLQTDQIRLWGWCSKLC